MGRFVSLLLNKIDKSIIIEFIFILLMFRLNLNTYFSKPDSSVPSVDYTKNASGMKMLENINEFNLYYFDILADKYKDLV